MKKVFAGGGGGSAQQPAENATTTTTATMTKLKGKAKTIGLADAAAVEASSNSAVPAVTSVGEKAETSAGETAGNGSPNERRSIAESRNKKDEGSFYIVLNGNFYDFFLNRK